MLTELDGRSHRRMVAAVAVDNRDRLELGASRADNLDEHRGGCRGSNGKRPRETSVLPGSTDRQCRGHNGVDHVSGRRFSDRDSNTGIGVEGKVRTVLFCRAERNKQVPATGRDLRSRHRSKASGSHSSHRPRVAL